MRAHALRVVRGCVVTNEHRSIKAPVDPAHHSAMPRFTADDPHIGRELLYQQVLLVAMGVRDDELRGPGLSRTFHGCQRFLRHEVAKALVLERSGSQLVSGNYARHSLHIHRYKNLDLPRLLAVTDRNPRGYKEQDERASHVFSL